MAMEPCGGAEEAEEAGWGGDGSLDLGRWAGLVEEAGSLGGRLAGVLGGEEGPEAQATAAAALRSLFTWWFTCGPQLDEETPRGIQPYTPRLWVESEALPGLLRLAGDRRVSQATRATALDALGDAGRGDLLEAQQLDALRQAAFGVLDPDEPFHEELLCSAFRLMSRLEYLPPRALQSALVSVLRRLRLPSQEPRAVALESREALWWCASEVLVRLAGESGNVLAVEGAARELVCFIEADDRCGSFFRTRSVLRELSPEALWVFLAGGGAGLVVEALSWHLCRLYPDHVGGRFCADHSVDGDMDGVRDVVGRLAELMSPETAGPAAALVRARLLEDAGLGALLPRLRRLIGEDLVEAHNYTAVFVSDLRAKLKALIERYHSALHPCPTLSRLPASIVFYTR